MYLDRSITPPVAVRGDGDPSVARVPSGRSLRLLREFAAEFVAAVEPILTSSQRGPRKVHAVVLLATRRQLAMRELTEATGLGRAAATDVVGRLCAAGIAVRSRHPDDRRSTVVTLTPRGDRAAALAVTRLGAAFDDAGALAADLVREIDTATTRRIAAPSGPIDTGELATRISALGVAIRDGLVVRSSAPVPEGRSLGALLVVGERGVARPNEIAAELRLTSGGMTYVLERLEERDLVQRTFGDLDDRRAVTVTLTEAGAAVVASLHAAVADAAVEIGAAFAQVRDHAAAPVQ